MIPPALDPVSAFGLIAAAGLGTAITTAAGAGGGLLLLAVMTLVLPVSTALPLHGLIQGGSNVARTALLRHDIRWRLVLAFAAGATVGTAAGAQALTAVPGHWLEFVLGLFILVCCWVPVPGLATRSSLYTVGGGAATSALTLFVGATGPLVAALLRAMRLQRHAHMATFSACMALQHGLKTVAFGLAGFAFGPYLPWLAAALGGVVAGNWIGRHLLDGISDRWFARIVSVLLTVLALRLIADALTTAGLLPDLL